MSLAAPTPPLLLTKRLAGFLQANPSPHIHTSLLATLSGKVLAHASPHSLTTLRTQATVAASLWALYSSPPATATTTTATTTTANLQHALPAESPAHWPGDATSRSITFQLTGAVLVIRLLKCGLLFICIGPVAELPDSASVRHLHQQTRPVQASHTHLEPQPSPLLGSPSEVESVVSAGAATTTSVATATSIGASAVVVMRRHAEELARWLNDKLGSLGVPDEMGTSESR
ncbi:hypothetical protein GGS20DRAFT_438318 [Poronia punctata]|nr:hypothetical protein GGS20DRAFT_438318 [Poronia punctata]